MLLRNSFLLMICVSARVLPQDLLVPICLRSTFVVWQSPGQRKGRLLQQSQHVVSCDATWLKVIAIPGTRLVLRIEQTH